MDITHDSSSAVMQATAEGIECDCGVSTIAQGDIAFISRIDRMHRFDALKEVLDDFLDEAIEGMAQATLDALKSGGSATVMTRVVDGVVTVTLTPTAGEVKS